MAQNLNDEIERYKKQMMNLYSSKSKPQTAAKPDIQPIPAKNSIQKTPAKQNFTKGNYSYQNTEYRIQNTDKKTENKENRVQNQNTEYKVQNMSSKFPKPDSSYIERIAPAPVFPSAPDTGYIEAPVVEPVVPDTGYIEAPATEPVVPDTGYIEAPVVEPVVPDTGYIEAPDFNADGEENGYLSVQVTTANRAIPVADAMVLVTEELPSGGTNLIRMLITDESGYTEAIPLPVPVYDLNKYPDPKTKPYRDYRVHVFADGYYIVPNIQVPIFSGVKSLQPVYLVPLAENEPELSFYPSIDTDNTVSISQANFN
ncbi:MAG: hypothetical protein LBM87_07455 [Ruminococcus sp.]|jgi:hypothetical protein|nr:hypothetical protein [Ruminococcus sp.]